MAELRATVVIQPKIVAVSKIKSSINAVAVINTLAPIGEVCTPYDLIDGGAAGTTYVPINGFNLISGGGA